MSELDRNSHLERARILLRQKRYKDAEQHAAAILKGNPNDALEKANAGLAVNAQDLTCLNARSQALFRLKDKTAAYDTIKEALNVDPDDDFTHTNFGWHFMEAGKHKKAREHFRQALRINPN